MFMEAQMELQCTEPGCGFRAQSKAGLVNHRRQKHRAAALETLTCQHCGGQYRRQGLHNHVKFCKQNPSKSKCSRWKKCVCVCVCVCACVHTKGPFMLMEIISLLFLCFFLNLTTAIEPPPPHTYTHHLHIHIQLPPPHPPPVCVPLGGRKKTTSASCNG